MVQDALNQVTPPQQKGFLKGRFMIDHLVSARDLWVSNKEGIYVALDYSKAYDTVSHFFAESVFRYMNMPSSITAVLLSLLKAPLVFIVGGGVYMDHEVLPKSGIRQGDPLSSALFSLIAALIIPDLDKLPFTVITLMYADDVLLFIPGTLREATERLEVVIWHIRVFGQFCGLQLNMAKSKALIRCQGANDPQEVAGMEVVDEVRYLGIPQGHILAARAYALALGKIMG